MEFSERQTYWFPDFVEINPSVKLREDMTYSFVEIKDLDEGKRSVYPSAKRKLPGDASFWSGDILFARTIPRLEKWKNLPGSRFRRRY